MEKRSFKHRAEVVFCQPHGDTLVRIDCGITGGKLSIPTEEVPPSLRAIGSKFIVTGNWIHADQSDSAEEIRAARKVTILPE